MIANQIALNYIKDLTQYQHLDLKKLFDDMLSKANKTKIKDLTESEILDGLYPLR